MTRTIAAIAALTLALAACQAPPPPAPPAATQPAPRPDPTPNALQSYQASLAESDPAQAVVVKVESLSTKGAAGVTVIEGWQLLPAVSRENSAQDLYNIWVGEYVGAGGSRSEAQILILDRSGKTVAQVHSGGVRLK